MEFAALSLPDQPRLMANITHFARALRAAGLPAGGDRLIAAIRAVAALGFEDRATFFYTLRACFTSKPEHMVVFAQVFRLYWRDPRYLEHMMSLMLPAIRGVSEERVAQAGEKRAAEALLEGVSRDMPDLTQDAAGSEIEIDATATMSTQERLRQLDFEQMSNAEMAQAKRVIAQMRLPVPPLKVRRMRAALRGPQVDWRATLRRSLRHGGEVAALARRAPRERMPALICLCDISGSMSAYSRAVLHFLHSVANAKGQGWAKVHGFTFGTRLTNITRHLRGRDVDAALAAAGAEAQDWQGGTRIGHCLTRFNHDWARRVLGQGAVVIVITDGLDRDDPAALDAAMARLSRSCRHLIWINPLLRWQGFAPKAGGIRAMLPHVDSFRAGHNIAALEGLAQALAAPQESGEKARLMALLTQD